MLNPHTPVINPLFFCLYLCNTLLWTSSHSHLNSKSNTTLETHILIQSQRISVKWNQNVPCYHAFTWNYLQKHKSAEDAINLIVPRLYFHSTNKQSNFFYFRIFCGLYFFSSAWQKGKHKKVSSQPFWLLLPSLSEVKICSTAKCRKYLWNVETSLLSSWNSLVVLSVCQGQAHT
jgi:hypothetical protein